jgi:hypothetical protein
MSKKLDNAVYRGLTSEDLDMLIKASISDFDLWDFYQNDESSFYKHIERVDAAYNEIIENTEGQ